MRDDGRHKASLFSLLKKWQNKFFLIFIYFSAFCDCCEFSWCENDERAIFNKKGSTKFTEMSSVFTSKNIGLGTGIHFFAVLHYMKRRLCPQCGGWNIILCQVIASLLWKGRQLLSAIILQPGIWLYIILSLQYYENGDIWCLHLSSCLLVWGFVLCDLFIVWKGRHLLVSAVIRPGLRLCHVISTLYEKGDIS